jgi:LysR family hydrogen peroxide-inducible transcriptional activator
MQTPVSFIKLIFSIFALIKSIMNFQQLEYIAAVAQHKHFGRAAAACNITQPTLSTMIQKLEEELGSEIFDRSRQPVVITQTGRKIIEQALLVLKEARQLKAIAQPENEEIAGKFQLGIIPTLAPYLLPRFLSSFLDKYPKVCLEITEQTTEQIADLLKRDRLDAALLATPLRHKGLTEKPLFYERFVAYVSGKEEWHKKSFVPEKSIDVSRLWLLEEGHCMRIQSLNLCELRGSAAHRRLEYASGSIETLIRMVETQGGMTILPELALDFLSVEQHRRIRFFKDREPVREISLVSSRSLKKNMLNALLAEIDKILPPDMKTRAGRRVVDL